VTVEKPSYTKKFVLILAAAVLHGCVHYYSKFHFNGFRNAAPTTTYSLLSDSDQVRDRIHSEELRQADENRRIKELPPPNWKDSAAAKSWLEASDKLIDLQARSTFLSDLKAMPAVDVPATAQGIVIGYSECRCTLSRSYEHLVRVRFKFGNDRRVVEGWICGDSIVMLHNLDL
jgi:hypothetical protein